jgi:hypothetical protein
MDRAADFESVGRGFESLQARHLFQRGSFDYPSFLLNICGIRNADCLRNRLRDIVVYGVRSSKCIVTRRSVRKIRSQDKPHASLADVDERLRVS